MADPFDPYSNPIPTSSSSNESNMNVGSAPSAASGGGVRNNPFDFFVGGNANNNAYSYNANPNSNPNAYSKNNGSTSATNHAHARNNNNNRNTLQGAPAWQQSARAVMANGSTVWKNSAVGSLNSFSFGGSDAGASGNSVGGGPGFVGRSNSNLGGSGNLSRHSSQGAIRDAKRIVPYSGPIATLESNWDPWLYIANSSSPSSLWKRHGNGSVYLIVRANESCVVRGGVETVLKWARRNVTGTNNGGGNVDLGRMDSLSLNDDRGSTAMQEFEDVGYNSTFGTSYETDANSSVNIASVNRAPGSRGGGGGLNFFRSGLKKAQATFERSVTTMAIRADGGKNPDWICASLHYVGRENGDAVNAAMGMALGLGNTNANVGLKELVSDVCLARTEWLPLPTAAGSTPASPVGSAARVDMSGIKFGIPLCVPDLAFLEAAAAGAAGAAGNIGPANSVGGVRLTVRLYLRSGATLLKAAANAGLKREYCVGESILQYSNVVGLALGMRNQQQQQQQQPASNEFLHSGIINLPFTSGMLAETSSFSPNNSTSNSKIDTPAALQIVATPRIKFNPPCTLGWSLTDPTTMPPTPPLSWLKMFQLPLDQGYVFSLDSSHEILNNAHNSTSQHPNQQFQRRPLPRAILLANERAVESAVVLPLATAVSSILSAAAIQSQQIAAISASRTFRRESIRTHAVTEDMEVGRANAIVDAALKDGCADVDVGVVALVILGVGAVMGGSLSSGGGLEGVPFVKTTMTFQRHDTIFEEALATGSAPMLDEPSGKAYIHNPSSGLGPKEAIKARFCPRILTGQPANDEDATLLPGVMGTKPDGKYVGNIRLEAIVRNTVNRSTSNLDIIDNCCDATSVYDAVAGVHGVNPRIEAYFELEHYLNPQTNPTGGKIPVTVPAIDTSTGQRIGSFLLLIRVKTPQVLNPLGNQSRIGEPLPPASSGLLSVVGMDAITDEIGLSPYFDYDPPSTQNSVQDTSAAGIRRRQVATMGSFLTPQFLRYQADVVRNDAALELANRHDKYNKSIASGLSSETDFDDEANVESFKRRNPKPFRPSNSRGDALLAGIGFNVHVQSLALNILQPDQSAIPAAICHSVTHGAPADHARGFGIQGNDGSRTFESVAEANAARGGLRRLEAKRADIARELETYVSSLINSVGEYFKSRAHTAAVMQQAGLRPTRHVAPNISSISFYRNKTTECAQRLQSLSWEIAVRRGNCFSQALGIAVTSYLTSISDGGPGWRGYANTWLRHGYLITFEGLLSAVGKELGMIEDASVAVEMLRMVHVVLVPDDGVSGTVNKNESSRQRIPVPHSPYVRWVHLAHLSKKGFGSKSMYRLEIGLNQSYYQRRVPEPLKGGAAVRFFPVLYQMGVDIRQWGVNAGRNVTSQIKERNKVGGVASAELGDNSDAATEASSDFNGCGLIDDGDDDDEGGVADNEILMALNVEGFRKMNAYAHSVIPTTAGVTAATSPLAAFYPSEHAQLQPLPPHPILSSLSEAIKTSAGKMEHGVLDKSATACQRLGGGSTVFCKSGKDRTAMQVTFKQAQFLQRLMDKKPSTTLEDSQILYDDVFEHATLMRIHGTRVPICEKNAGEAKYAFNPLQAKFMPEMLKPPPITLAGFLKKPET